MDNRLPVYKDSNFSEKIRAMFADISENYDFLNTFFSFGFHHLWKKKMVNVASPKSGDKVLDCATGTGDIAFLLKKKIKSKGQVIGVDFCESFIQRAKKRADKKQISIYFQYGDILSLPFEDEFFDITTASFAIRNVSDPIKALNEMARVTKSGGKIVILETGQPNGIFGIIYRWYMKNIIPFLSQILIRDKSYAYLYFIQSSSHFPYGKDFEKIIQKNYSFSNFKTISLTRGIVYIYLLNVKHNN